MGRLTKEEKTKPRREVLFERWFGKLIFEAPNTSYNARPHYHDAFIQGWTLALFERRKNHAGR